MPALFSSLFASCSFLSTIQTSRSSYFTGEQSNKLFVPQRHLARFCKERGRTFPKASAIKFTIHAVDMHVAVKQSPPSFPSLRHSSSNFLRRIIRKRKSLRYLREEFFSFPFFLFLQKKQGREKSDFLPRFSVSPPRKLWII